MLKRKLDIAKPLEEKTVEPESKFIQEAIDREEELKRKQLELQSELAASQNQLQFQRGIQQVNISASVENFTSAMERVGVSIEEVKNNIIEIISKTRW